MLEFTSWDAGLRSDTLQHHGIPGMHWGQRRYQNEDGSLTAAGKARYGLDKGEGQRHTSARKMQRDFNNLDEGYANVAAEHHHNLKKMQRAQLKTEKRYATKGYDPSNPEKALSQDKKLRKLANKAVKSAKKAEYNAKQMAAIENLQWRILAKAHDAGYTASTKKVKRVGTTKAGRAMSNIVLLTGGGVIPGVIAGAARRATAYTVEGQKAKIRKNGPGGVTVDRYTPNSTSGHHSRSSRRRR